MKENLSNIVSYIKEVMQLRNKSISDFGNFEQSFDYNFLCKKYKDFIQKNDDLSILTDGVFLKVQYIQEKQKKTLPEIPEELEEYLEIEQGQLNELVEDFELVLKEKSLEKKYDEFIEEFNEVKEYNKLIEQYNELYLKLYNYYKRINEYEEKMEFVLCTNLLVWKYKNEKPIKRHILEAPVDVTIEPYKNIISFSINNEKKKEMVMDFLNDKNYHKKDSAQLYDLVANFNIEVNETGNVDLKKEINQYVNAISYENDIIDKLFSDCKIEDLKEEHTYVFNDIHIIIRNKNTKLWVDDIERLEKNCEKNEVDSTILNLLDIDYSDNEKVNELLNCKYESKENDQILFPLESNEEQYRIVDRVRTGNVVLVQGPPGTGKSHTIANLISHFISEGKKVVVTSEKAKALEVIREKLPVEIRSLSLALLSSEGIDKELEYSIQKVQKKYEEAEHKEELKSQIDELYNQLKNVREQKIKNEKEIIRLMSEDTKSNEEELKQIIQGELINYSLSDIAQWLSKNKQYDLIPIEDKENIEYADLIGLFESLNTIANDIKEHQYDVSKRVEEQEYLKDNSISQIIMECENIEKYELKYSDLSNVIVMANLTDNLIEQMKEKMNDLNEINTIIGKEWIKEHMNYTVFKDILNNLIANCKKEKEKIHQDEMLIWEYDIQYDREKTSKYLLAIQEIQSKLKNKEEITGLFKMMYNSNLKVIKEISVKRNNESCIIINKNLLNIIEAHLNHETLVLGVKQELNKLFNKDVFKILNISEKEFGKDIDELVSFLEKVANYAQNEKILDECIATVINTKLMDVSVDKLEKEELKNMLLDLQFYHDKGTSKVNLNKKIEQIQQDYKNFNLKYLKDVIISIQNKDIEQLNVYLKHLKEEINIINKYNNLKDTYNYFFPEKEGFIHKYIYVFEDDTREFAVANIKAILKYHFVNKYYNKKEQSGKNMPKLFERKEDLQHEEKNIIKKLIEVKGWYNQIANMTPDISRSLASWMQLRKKYGKGTGKSLKAQGILKQMQQEMLTAQKAIPVWIMPVDKLVEQYQLTNDPPFDILIMDESSQTSVLHISALTRGKKIIIVGDDKQISPISVGVGNEQIEDLKTKYLRNNLWSGLIEESTSIYDIIEMVCASKKIVLKEHFRCLPEIINYSNRHFYNNEINPLKVRSKEHTITKPILTYYVEEGTCKKIGNKPYNEQEIEKIIELLKDISNDSQYNKKTIGIIVLQNSEKQLQEIDKRIMTTFGQHFIEERKIKLGNTYDFQGDERDVIILSMIVSSVDPDGEPYRFSALTKKEFDRSFNVAASRAKEQMILVHSVTIEQLNPECNRYKLLNYCETYDKIQEKQIEEKFESIFERDVYYSLQVKGIKLIPQYVVGAYRIDFICENNAGKKVAIECDGDRFHSIDQYDRDLRRQTVLERCGWKFVRIRASEYYYDKDKATEKIYKEISNYLDKEDLIV